MTAIHVDFLAPGSHRLPGRLGLTIAPGRVRPGRDPASDTLIEEDLLRLQEHYGARLLITLLEEFEMRKYGISRLLAEARRMKLRTAWFPIADVSVPSDLPATGKLVEQIVGAMKGGDTVVVHCLGGLGRSGTIAACCLVALGRHPAAAIQLVRAVRPGAVEVAWQEDFVRRFAAAVSGE